VSLNSSKQKKLTPTGIHQLFLNVSGDQTEDESTAKQWVVQVTSVGADFYQHSMQALVHCCKNA